MSDIDTAGSFSSETMENFKLYMSALEDVTYTFEIFSSSMERRFLAHPKARDIFKRLHVESRRSDEIGSRVLQTPGPGSLEIQSLRDTVAKLKAEAEQLCDEINRDPAQKVDYCISSEGASSSSGGRTTSIATNEAVVGFNEDLRTLLEMLDSKVKGDLEIISIVGAAGGGKTTLAKEVYEHHSTSKLFTIRSWVNVHQDYMKRSLLISILKSAVSHRDFEKSSDDELGEETLVVLKGKKYLIVMDDIWSIEAWNDIQRSLPKECNGSKVLFTSRLPVEPDNIRNVPHCLTPLSESQSWELLQKKVFGNKSCPTELVGIGKHIAEKCKGLPLAIIAIAGILAKEKMLLDVWEEVPKRLSSIITQNQDGCMEILELSYNYLPLHLRPCFVYVGGFPHDSEILVKELLRLWIAEGFIQQEEGDKSLEVIAKDYLSDLIKRNLVMVAGTRFFNGIESCRIHDVLRELCVRKAEKDNSLLQIYGDAAFSPSAATKRLFIGKQFFHEFSSSRPYMPNLSSFLCLSLPDYGDLSVGLDLPFFAENFKLLKVLCFNSAELQGKIGSGDLVDLRYLAIRLADNPSDYWQADNPSDFLYDFLNSISYLLNLETLHVQAQWNSRKWKTIPLPRDIFKMVKLRHLYARRGVFTYHDSCSDTAVGIGFDRSFKLDNLQTLNPLCPCKKCQNFLEMTPNIRKLVFFGKLASDDSVLMLPNLEFLKCLETLKIGGAWKKKPTTLWSGLKFPPTLTRLTLMDTWLKWEELSILQTLPSLEVLKLVSNACVGETWDTSELEFPQLKYLKLGLLGIKEWIASEDQFPKLEVLMVLSCMHLEGIPNDFAKLYDLREIGVTMSHSSLEESLREIQEQRRDARGADGCITLWVADGSLKVL